MCIYILLMLVKEVCVKQDSELMDVAIAGDEVMVCDSGTVVLWSTLKNWSM